MLTRTRNPTLNRAFGGSCSRDPVYITSYLLDVAMLLHELFCFPFGLDVFALCEWLLMGLCIYSRTEPVRPDGKRIERRD